MDEDAPYQSMRDAGTSGIPVHPTMGYSWWDKEKGRYRTKDEQRKYEIEQLERLATYYNQYENKESKKVAEESKKESERWRKIHESAGSDS